MITIIIIIIIIIISSSSSSMIDVFCETARAEHFWHSGGGAFCAPAPLRTVILQLISYYIIVYNIIMYYVILYYMILYYVILLGRRLLRAVSQIRRQRPLRQPAATL